MKIWIESFMELSEEAELYLTDLINIRYKINSRDSKYKRKFGTEPLTGVINYPKSFSNVKLARILHTDTRGGCPFCFPHGFETTNSKYSNYQRNWKKYRRTQWK